MSSVRTCAWSLNAVFVCADLHVCSVHIICVCISVCAYLCVLCARYLCVCSVICMFVCVLSAHYLRVHVGAYLFVCSVCVICVFVYLCVCSVHIICVCVCASVCALCALCACVCACALRAWGGWCRRWAARLGCRGKCRAPSGGRLAEVFVGSSGQQSCAGFVCLFPLSHTRPGSGEDGRAPGTAVSRRGPSPQLAPWTQEDAIAGAAG